MADPTPGNAPPPTNGLPAVAALVAPQQSAKPSTPSPSPAPHITKPGPTSSVANHGHPSPQLPQAKPPTPGQGAPKNGVGAGPVPTGANGTAPENSGGARLLPEQMNGIAHRNGDAAGHPLAAVNGTKPAPFTGGGNTAVSTGVGNAPPFKGQNYPLRSSPQLTPDIVHRQNLSQSPQYVAQYERLTAMIQETSPDIVQVVAREQFAKCILGSDYHVAFILNAIMFKADPSVFNRAFLDFGGDIVRACKSSIIGHLKQQDVDEIADLIYSRASNGFLDKGLARRLETIPARQLVNALARAERLGYDVKDIVEEGQANGAEHVIPSIALANQSHAFGPHASPALSQSASPAPVAAAPTAMMTAQPMRQAPAVAQTPQPQAALQDTIQDGLCYCSICRRPCSGQPALRYHQTRGACRATTPVGKVGKECCPHCGVRFTSTGGIMYHAKTNVCGRYSDEQLRLTTSLLNSYEPPALSQQQGAAAQAGGIPTRQPPTTQSPANSTPTTPSTAPTKPASQTGSVKDPYASLTPEQRTGLENEMRAVEEHYGSLMRAAMALPGEQQAGELARIKNQYNTKQSMTRKKYGIRLRERRSKSQLDAEQNRLFAASGGLPSTPGGPSRKRPRSDTGTGSFKEPPPQGSQQPPSMGQTAPLAPLSQMNGGLSGSTATAELTDPTAHLRPTLPHPVPPSSNQASAMSRSEGTSNDPMQIEDD
ncbi:hypothetical protein S40293_08998 [Stachybotrys chartarum IBT 40293]|nr:hypothetical protein S40293_08998 [Stachybotrys chartarum IBT 40293]